MHTINNSTADQPDMGLALPRLPLEDAYRTEFQLCTICNEHHLYVPKTNLPVEVHAHDEPHGSGIFPISLAGSGDRTDGSIKTKNDRYNDARFPEFRRWLDTAFNKKGELILMVSRFRIWERLGLWDGKRDAPGFIVGTLDGDHSPVLEPHYNGGSSALCSVLGMPFSRYAKALNLLSGMGKLDDFFSATPGPLFIHEKPPLCEEPFRSGLIQMLWEKAFPEAAVPIPIDAGDRCTKMYIGEDEIKASPFADMLTVLEKAIGL